MRIHQFSHLTVAYLAAARIGLTRLKNPASLTSKTFSRTEGFQAVNYFHLFAHGEAFDPDAFLATSSLRPDYVWRRGDRRRGYPPEIADVHGHPTSGVEFVLGDGRVVPYPDQEQIAINFIEAQREELRALGQFSGVEHFILMFQYERWFEGDMVGGCVGASRQLMLHALHIRCRLDFTFIARRSEIAEPSSDFDV